MTSGAWDLHRRPRRALENAFADGDGVTVLEWNGTYDDEHTHELVELVIAAVGLAVKYVVIPGAKLLADKLVEAGVEMSVTEAVKGVFSRLRPKQEAREILDFHITLPDGTYIDVQPPDRDSRVTITTPGGPGGDLAREIEEVWDLGDVTVARVRLHGQGVESVAPTEGRSWMVGRWRRGKVIWSRNFRTEAEALEAAGLSE